MLKMASLIGVVMMSVTGCGREQADPVVTGDARTEAAATITVEAIEYEFQGIPETLPAAEITFALQNRGEEPHELSISLITGPQSVEELLELPEEKVGRLIQDLGHAFAPPGRSDELTVDLVPGGRYGYVCSEPTPDGTPHASLGMYGEFTVA